MPRKSLAILKKCRRRRRVKTKRTSKLTLSLKLLPKLLSQSRKPLRNLRRLLKMSPRPKRRQLKRSKRPKKKLKKIPKPPRLPRQ